MGEEVEEEAEEVEAEEAGMGEADQDLAIDAAQPRQHRARLHSQAPKSGSPEAEQHQLPKVREEALVRQQGRRRSSG